MRKLEKGEYIQVGDVIVTKHAFGSNKFKITRVTKRFAFSKRDSDGHEYKFKSICDFNMNVPYQPYNNVEYAVFRKQQ